MCDINICYSSILYQCPASKPNLIPAKDTVKFTFHFNPFEIRGIGHTWIELYRDKSFKTLLFSTHPNGVLNINRGITAAKDIENAPVEIIVYPNPVNQYLQIESSLAYQSISILDMLGKEIMSYQ